MESAPENMAALRAANESLLEACVDEGERVTDWDGLHPVMNRPAEDRPAIIEADPNAALWLGVNPPDFIPEPYRSVLVALAAHKSPTVRRAFVEAMVPVTSVPGEIEVRFKPSRETDTENFMARFHFDVAEMVRYEGMTRKDAEIEFTWRYAEELTGVVRKRNGWHEVDEVAQARLRKAQDAAYQRVYRNQ